MFSLIKGSRRKRMRRRRKEQKGRKAGRKEERKVSQAECKVVIIGGLRRAAVAGWWVDKGRLDLICEHYMHR